MQPFVSRYVAEVSKPGGGDPKQLEILSALILDGNARFEQLRASSKSRMSADEIEDFDKRTGNITGPALKLVGLENDTTAAQAQANILNILTNQAFAQLFESSPAIFNALKTMPPRVAALIVANALQSGNVLNLATIQDQLSKYFEVLATPPEVIDDARRAQPQLPQSPIFEEFSQSRISGAGVLTGDAKTGGLPAAIAAMDGINQRKFTTDSPEAQQSLETDLFLPSVELNGQTPFFAVARTIFSERTNTSTADRRLIVTDKLNAQFLEDFDKLQAINPNEAKALGPMIFQYLTDVAIRTTNDLSKDPQLGQTFGFQVDGAGNISIARRGETSAERVGPRGTRFGGTTGIGLPIDVPTTDLARVREQQLEFIKSVLDPLTKFSEFFPRLSQFSEPERKRRIAELLTTNFGLFGADTAQFERRMAKQFGRPDPAEAFFEDPIENENPL